MTSDAQGTLENPLSSIQTKTPKQPHGKHPTATSQLFLSNHQDYQSEHTLHFLFLPA